MVKMAPVLGVLAVGALVASAVIVSSGDRGQEELGERLDRLEAAIGELRTAVQALAAAIPADRESLTARDPLPADPWDHEPERVAALIPVEPAPPRRAADSAACPWTEYLPRALAQVLVEHGLSPFDPGVDRILPGAVQQTREVTRAANEQASPLSQHLKNIKQSDPLNEETRQALHDIMEARDRECLKIAEAFRAEIAAFARKQ